MDIEYINGITQTTCSQRDRYIRLYSNIDEETRLMLIKEQIRLNRLLREDHYLPEKNAEYIYCCTILSLKNSLSKACLSRKKVAVNVRLVGRLKVKTAEKQRARKKKNLIRLRYFQLITSLKIEENLSWAEIAKYLSQHHKFKVAPGYLQQVFLQLQKDI